MSGVLCAVLILAGGYLGYWLLMRSEAHERDERMWFEIEQRQRQRQREIEESKRIGWRRG